MSSSYGAYSDQGRLTGYVWKVYNQIEHIIVIETAEFDNTLEEI